MKPIFFALAAFCTLLASSCDRESDEDFILAGRKSGMHHQDHEIKIPGENPDHGEYKMDLDNDGTADLHFETNAGSASVPGVWGFLPFRSARVKCLRKEVYLALEQRRDTLYIANFDSVLWWNGNGIEIRKNIDYSCTPDFQHNIMGPIFDLQVLKVKNYDDGITLNDNWVSQEILLSSFTLLPEVRTFSRGQDTTVVEHHWNGVNCNEFPIYESWFGVKIEKDGMTKLGWIKMVIVGGDIRIIEWAIQK